MIMPLNNGVKVPVNLVASRMNERRSLNVLYLFITYSVLGPVFEKFLPFKGSKYVPSFTRLTHTLPLGDLSTTSQGQRPMSCDSQLQELENCIITLSEPKPGPQRLIVEVDFGNMGPNVGVNSDLENPGPVDRGAVSEFQRRDIPFRKSD